MASTLRNRLCFMRWPCNFAVDGKYSATARVCDVERHTWVGFRMDQHMEEGRYAYITVYFSHDGTWAGIEESRSTTFPLV